MSAVKFALVAPTAQVWHAALRQKNRNVLAQLVYKFLVSVKFNMTFIYLFACELVWSSGFKAWAGCTQ